MNKQIILLLFILISSFFFSCEKNLTNGKRELMKYELEPIGENCQYGGYKLLKGLDLNDNNILENDEIRSEAYLCNDYIKGDFIEDLIKIGPGENCSTGGFQITKGFDLNENNVLDSIEIIEREYYCNDNDGITLLNMLIEPVGDNCPAGGYKIERGVDQNSNMVLDPQEVQSISYMCNEYHRPSTTIAFSNQVFTTADTNWVTTDKFKTDFGLATYPTIDSIFFVPVFKVRDGDENNVCLVRLFNLTDSIEIFNSELETKSRESIWFLSPDLYNSMPEKYFHIAVQIKSSNGSGIVEVSAASILMY